MSTSRKASASERWSEALWSILLENTEFLSLLVYIVNLFWLIERNEFLFRFSFGLLRNMLDPDETASYL
jgi:hypothetical protein